MNKFSIAVTLVVTYGFLSIYVPLVYGIHGLVILGLIAISLITLYVIVGGKKGSKWPWLFEPFDEYFGKGVIRFFLWLLILPAWVSIVVYLSLLFLRR